MTLMPRPHPLRYGQFDTLQDMLRGPLNQVCVCVGGGGGCVDGISIGALVVLTQPLPAAPLLILPSPFSVPAFCLPAP